ncbi:hypothetical protein EJ02DRAFT_425495 [Clathrospora elynae]|uniref:Uncharacterized protein n=1 Tax=Clathrospora elynae TaxID=706981 RepID=A0A6A5SG14_9PLEO|nr:hypothetical protein EJ02DRAFT_425495 [Clathrospora elynae]
MKIIPMILVRDFDGLDICYRISARRARNYWELLESIHNTFSNTWDRYNAHLHFENDCSNGRISPREWDVGGYFEDEFVVDGWLVLFAHFEEVEGRVMDDVGDQGSYGVDRIWYWGTYGDEGVQKKGAPKGEVDEDPYPPFLEALPPDHLVLTSVIK